MTIWESNSVNVSKPQSERSSELRTTGSRTPSTSGSSAPKSDEIDVDVRNSLQTLASAVSDPDRARHVEELRQQYASGQYHVDANALSHSIVDAMLRGY